jgi:isoleucyl-tRNA synthetase
MSDSRFPEVPGGYPFPQLELDVLADWKARGIFEQSLRKPAPRGDFVFFEGPPTANNVPHVGHVVTRVVKDLFPRYRTMRGYRVPRKAGWDTHGLAVEIEVEKRLGFSGKQQIEEYGIEKFNQACLDSVHTYERQWRAMTERIGYWLDLDHAYLTYTNDYIESVWWALSELSRKGLLTEGYKIQPYCARCGTTLSSHEVAQNYKDVDDPSIWTLFPALPGQTLRTVDGDSWETRDGLKLVAWTTTPWTTLANVGLAVHPDHVYRVIENPAHPGELIFLGDKLGTAVPLVVDEEGKRKQIDLREQPALARFQGRDLENLLYQRLFTFFAPDAPGRVVLGDYVTESEGTGLVHTAPPFGEDDYQTGKRYGLPMILSVDGEGKLVPGAGPFAGLWFKDADPKIMQDLKSRGLLLHADRYRHSYPFCWRCDRPLLYYATTSWFVRTTAEKQELVDKNKEIHWHPEHIGEGRFGNWLENVVDWALSRKRYWGTPLPVWRCTGGESCSHQEVIGSYAELFQKSGRPLPENPYDPAQFNPHRPYIDAVTWPCGQCGQGTMKRVEEVIDAWFDSGSMPFAQHHYPFQSRELIDGRTQFPADFIAEAVDQTRGWFYTLHVLGTLLFDSVAYKNCIVLGHVNDEQGRKMSKRLGNVVEPMAVIKETGADALRWYFCVNNPEQPSRFSARLVREAAQKFLLPLWNAFSFFTIYANLDAWQPRATARPWQDLTDLDRWILLRLDRLIREVTERLDSYDVTGAARPIEEFLDDLTNWYIRRSRDRFWGGREHGDLLHKEVAYQTLYQVLTTLARLVAPFTPFVAEMLYKNLVRHLYDEEEKKNAPASVHLESWPQFDDALFTGESLANFQGMNLILRFARLGRAARNTHNLKVRQPLAAATLIANFPAATRPHVDRFVGLLKEELNVKEILWAEERGVFVHHEVKPVFSKLGKRLGKRVQRLKEVLTQADGDRLAEELNRFGKIVLDLDGEPIELARDEVEIELTEKEGRATAGDRELLVALDVQITPELQAEGRAREVIHHIQANRKERQLDYADRIRIRFNGDREIVEAIQAHREWIEVETLALALEEVALTVEFPHRVQIDDLSFGFEIEKVPY